LPDWGLGLAANFREQRRQAAGPPAAESGASPHWDNLKLTVAGRIAFAVRVMT
jgi:hypothetical protein